jgi:hypothetical protein
MRLVKYAAAFAMLALVALFLTACGGDSTQAASTQAGDSITILQTDLEAQPMGEGQQCIDRLSKVVDTDYLVEHDVAVEDEGTAAFAIENAIVKVCDEGPPDQIVHASAHEVVHMVEDELAGG